jgi:serine/threonine protein phosphatase PrpC
MSEFATRGTPAISFGEACDRGKVREENQDSVRNASIPLGELFVVADGIGGYQGGATASRMVVEGFYSQLAGLPANYPPDQALIEANAYTNATIHAAAMSGDPSLQRMGSTVVLALIQMGASTSGNSGEVSSFGPVAWIGHVGDSRAYLIRAGQMIKLTNDHSAVQALLNRNLITEEEARNHPDASVLTRSLGHRPEVEIEIDRVPLMPGDALLLCSDGLWGYVAEADIAAVATDQNLSVQTMAETLLHQALAAGGLDNIGIEYIRIGGSAALIPPSIPQNGRPAGRITAKLPVALSSTAMGGRRRQQMLALGLLLLGGCGYLGVAAYSHYWPFRQSPPKTDPRIETATGATAAGTGNAGNPKPERARNRAEQGAKDSQPKQPDGQVNPQVNPQINPQPNPASTGKQSNSKKILVVGELNERNSSRPARGEIEWKFIPVTRENNPECSRYAEDKTVVYTKTPESLDSIVKQHPILRGRIDAAGSNPLQVTPAITAACGEEYDVIVILPAKKSAAAASPPSDEQPEAPASAKTTDSQSQAPPVQQQPKPKTPH